MNGVKMINVHAEGEIGYIAYEGVPDIPGETVADKLAFLNSDDSLRRFLTLGPRANPAASVNLLFPPTGDHADAGFVILQPDQAHASSGSNSICMVTGLLESGLFPMQEPETTLRLETASGVVLARAECLSGKVKRVHLDMVPAFVEEMDMSIATDEWGKITADICYGGIFYALVDATHIGVEIRPENAAHIAAAGMRLKNLLNRSYQVAHPEIPAINGIGYVMFRGEDDDGAIRTATTMWPGRLDRSPCGTGSSAQLAVMEARGQIKAGESFVTRSTIGSEFTVTHRGMVETAGRSAVLPQISGRGWVFGHQTISRDETDPFYDGIAITDVWGPEAGLLNRPKSPINGQ